MMASCECRHSQEGRDSSRKLWEHRDKGRRFFQASHHRKRTCLSLHTRLRRSLLLGTYSLRKAGTDCKGTGCLLPLCHRRRRKQYPVFYFSVRFLSNRRCKRSSYRILLPLLQPVLHSVCLSCQRLKERASVLQEALLCHGKGTSHLLYDIHYHWNHRLGMQRI